MFRSMVLCLLLQSNVHGRFIGFFHVKCQEKQIVLIADCHGKERHASHNRAALINLAHTLGAHVIVEDMSDYSLFTRYMHVKYDEFSDFFTLHSMHSRKRLAYTSLSLTHHCRRKGIPVTNVEFRHGSSANRCSILEREQFVQLLQTLVATISENTRLLLSKKHKQVLEAVVPFFKYMQPVKKDHMNESVSYECEVEPLTCLMLDNLIMQRIHEIQNASSHPIIVCAGAFHIDNIKEMLLDAGYRVQGSSERDAYSQRELDLQGVFEKQFYDQVKEKKCASSVSVGINDRKRVYWTVTKKALVSGAALTSLASLFYIYTKKMHW